MTNTEIPSTGNEEIDKLTDLFERLIKADSDEEKYEIAEEIEHQLALAHDSGLDISEFYKMFVECLEADGKGAFEQFTHKTGLTREDLRSALEKLKNQSQESD